MESAVSPQKYAVSPGDVFPVDYVISWEGPPEAYVVMPPTLPALEWGTAEVLETRTRRRNNRQESIVTIGYTAHEKGMYTAPSLSLRVLAWDTVNEEQITRLEEADTLPAQVVETEAVELVFRDRAAGLWLGIIAVLIISGGVGVWYRARKRRDDAEDAAATPVETAQALLHQARRHRLDADYYDFYRALCGAVACIEQESPTSHAALLDKLKQAADNTGYRGVRPTDDALAGDFKDVERIVAQEMERITKET